jgi:hypothetical protein
MNLLTYGTAMKLSKSFSGQEYRVKFRRQMLPPPAWYRKIFTDKEKKEYEQTNNHQWF